jgi:hypothetical protein
MSESRHTWVAQESGEGHASNVKASAEESNINERFQGRGVHYTGITLWPGIRMRGGRMRVIWE